MPKKKPTIDTQCHKSLIRWIRTTRKSSGMSQRQFAKKIHHSQTWIARVEAGERRVDVCEFILMTRVLGRNPADVLSDLDRHL